MKWSAAIKEGIVAAWPICLGYLAIGVAFGVIAQKAGLHPLEIGLMSVVVYAGSSQFIAVSMLVGGSAIMPIIATTFMVNLRHLLMSSSLSIYLKSVNGGWLALFAYGVTDESFALNLSRFRNDNWNWQPALVLNHTTNITWVGSTVAGGFGGQFIPAGAFGIDYALTAMFICLLVFQLRGNIYILVAIMAGGLAVGLSLIISGNSHIIISSIVAATLGVLFRRYQLSHREENDS
ncbi:MAG: AzlC family ABC transporter permease [Deltaproteobacteria bacterium]|nr:AzlC family ABC transporter permease [Deltaproteobacteria bacterium]